MINQSENTIWIPQGQYIGKVNMIKCRTSEEEEAHKIIQQLQSDKVQVNEISTQNDDFIASDDQVQLKISVISNPKADASLETHTKLENMVSKFSDILSKNKYD